MPISPTPPSGANTSSSLGDVIFAGAHPRRAARPPSGRRAAPVPCYPLGRAEIPPRRRSPRPRRQSGAAGAGRHRPRSRMSRRFPGLRGAPATARRGRSRDRARPRGSRRSRRRGPIGGAAAAIAAARCRMQCHGRRLGAIGGKIGGLIFGSRQDDRGSSRRSRSQPRPGCPRPRSGCRRSCGRRTRDRSAISGRGARQARARQRRQRRAAQAPATKPSCGDRPPGAGSFSSSVACRLPGGEIQARPRRPRPALWRRATIHSGPRSPARGARSASALVESTVSSQSVRASAAASRAPFARTVIWPRRLRHRPADPDRRRTG